MHRKLCARNVFLSPDGASVKVGGFGISDYSKPNEDMDHTRWTAQEVIGGGQASSKYYASKCDVWSFGCTLWEIATLGSKLNCVVIIFPY